MEEITAEAPLAELQEDLEDPDLLEMDRKMYLPDDLYWFKRPDLGHSLLEKRSTYYLTDDDYNVVKRAVLNVEKLDQDLIKEPMATTVLDETTGNVDYRLERNLKSLCCVKPFRKVDMKIKSDNGLELFAINETKRNKTFTIAPISGQEFRIQRDPANQKLFSILDGKAIRLGSIEKSWEPLFGMPTLDGHYHIKFNENAADLNDEIKYIVLLSIFLLVREVVEEHGVIVTLGFVSGIFIPCTSSKAACEREVRGLRRSNFQEEQFIDLQFIILLLSRICNWFYSIIKIYIQRIRSHY